jgi:hypothetical protein
MTKRGALTEEQWLHNTSPFVLLKYLRHHCNVARVQGGRRRLRLFCCTCCRQVWPLLGDERSRRAVEVSEQFADGLIRKVELRAAEEQARAVYTAARDRLEEALQNYPVWALETRPLVLHAAVASAAEGAAAPSVSARTAQLVSEFVATATAYCDLSGAGPQELEQKTREASAEHCRLLRDVFGNPFRPVPFDPVWLERNDGAARKLASVIYDERTFEQMPILGDALEEAGCPDESVLTHCRSGGPHARGCWVLDLLAGR